jgi:hypothetical protein
MEREVPDLSNSADKSFGGVVQSLSVMLMAIDGTMMRWHGWIE